MSNEGYEFRKYEDMVGEEICVLGKVSKVRRMGRCIFLEIETPTDNLWVDIISSDYSDDQMSYFYSIEKGNTLQVFGVVEKGKMFGTISLHSKKIVSI